MNDISIIKEKLIDLIYKAKPVAAEPMIPAEIEGTYKYADIDYSYTETNNWRPQYHVDRIYREVINAGRGGILPNSPLHERIIGALRYWIAKDPLCNNWWSNQIGVPLCIGKVAVAIQDLLPEDVKAGIEKILLRGSFKTRRILGADATDLPDRKCYKTADVWTGANLLWGAMTSIYHAVFTSDGELFSITRELVEGELSFDGEGIKEDGGFIQHGNRWYSAGYGISFAADISTVIYLLDGTEYAISKDKLGALYKHLLDGLAYMQRNGCYDFNASGREYTRRGALNKSYSHSLELLLSCRDVERRDELMMLKDAVSQGKDEIVGTKYYESINQLCHKAEGVYIGVRGKNPDAFCMEHCNGEAILSYNMTYGTITCFMESGFEYYNISPFWDYSRIPGTTARAESDEELLRHGNWICAPDSVGITRGAAKDGVGVLTEEFSHNGVSGIATYFTYGGALIALGTDIYDHGNPSGIATTVEQCLAKSAEINDNLVRRGCVTYKNLDTGTRFHSTLETRSGSWSRNSTSASRTVLYDTLLTVTIPYSPDHPSYAYTVFKGEEPDIEILQNDKSCRAVLLGGDTLAAVFDNDGGVCCESFCVHGKRGEIKIVKFKENSI